MLGEPTGVTAKFWFARAHAFQLGFGWGVETEGHLVVIGDYVYHFIDAIPPVERAGRFVPYLGIGARFAVRYDEGLFGVRIPLGMSFLIRSAPIEVFVEVALGISLIPETRGIFDGVLGGRFYF
jgi:hypothetical protein